MRLGTNHFHSDGGMGWDFIVSEIFFPQAVQEVEYLFSNCKWLFKLKYIPQVKIMKGTNHFLTEKGWLFVCFLTDFGCFSFHFRFCSLRLSSLNC
jgi:hypothetical protein